MTPTIYLSARFQRRDEMRELRERLRGIAHVKSQWLDEPADTPSGICAWHDVVDIESEDLTVFVAFTEPPGTWTSGGRHVEYGIALGLRLPIWIVGPDENVFHALAWEQFDTTEQLIEALKVRFGHGS